MTFTSFEDIGLQKKESNPSGDDCHVLDTLVKKFNLKNDAELARLLQIGPPALSKIRHHKAKISPALIIRIHEVTGMSIKEIRALMGDHAPLYRIAQ